MTVTVQIDAANLGEAAAMLQRLGASLSDLTPVMDAIGAYVVSSTMRRFAAGRDPDNFPWRPSIRARTEGGQTMVQSGRLRSSLTRQATADSVKVGTNVIYAAIHQFGGTIKPRAKRALAFKIGGRPVLAGRVTMPRRAFLGVNADDERSIGELVRDYIEAARDGRVFVAPEQPS